MHDTDTKVIEYNKMAARQSKSTRFSNWPFIIASMLIIAVAATLVIVVAKRTSQRRGGGVIEASFSPILKSAREITSMDVAKPVPPPVKFNHVIFRLGDVEVFRFTYEDSEDAHYSFEVREGSS